MFVKYSNKSLKIGDKIFKDQQNHPKVADIYEISAKAYMSKNVKDL
jgi:hypothetical protein